MRRSGTVLPATLAALILLGTVITPGTVTEAVAGPVPPQAISITQSLGNSPHSTQEQVNRAQATLRNHPTGDALNHLGEAGKQLAVTTTSSPRLSEGPVAMAATDPVTWAECDANVNNHGEDGYWYKNKYNLCRTVRLTLYYREPINNVPTVVGTTAVTVQFKGTAINGQSSIVFALRMRDFADNNRTHKEWPLSIQVPCSNADTARTSTCSESSGNATIYRKTVAEWEASAGTEFTWIKNTATTAVQAEDKYKVELRGFFAAGLYKVLESPLSGPDVVSDPPALARCDSATYVYGSKCVFPNVTSVLEFKVSNKELSESAEFIRDAQNDITLTKPGHADKKVPGKLGDLPLHRLHSSYDTNNDIKAATRKVPKTCRLYFGPKYTDNNTKQCDEYPFKTTYENAARVDPRTNYDYAVRAIKKEHNEKAGRDYGAWLGADRILDGDPFFVRIVP